MDNYKEYIQDSAINRLERLMGNEEVEDVCKDTNFLANHNGP